MLMSRPLPNVSEAYYMLLQEEHQREMSSETHIIPQSATLIRTTILITMVKSFWVYWQELELQWLRWKEWWPQWSQW